MGVWPNSLELPGTIVLLLFALLSGTSPAQEILFDFNDAPIHSPLPVDLVSGGITAHLSATGQGFSIQPADTMGFTPAGFSGNCVYPSSIFSADLRVSFSRSLTEFSILYAPQELGCDDSATLRVTGYRDATPVATNTATAANPGTWPSETLRLSSPAPFNRVVIHYDAKPPTCQDWGPIFMADNMRVTPAPTEPILTNPMLLTSGAFQFSCSDTPGRGFSVFGTTNMSLPFAQWRFLGNPAEISPGLFQFTDAAATNYSRQFYRLTSP